MADPKWYVAIGESEEFCQSDKRQPWHWALTTEQISVLQHPGTAGDPGVIARRVAWRRALDDSIVDGSLLGVESGGKFSGARLSTPDEAASIAPMLQHLGLPPGSECSTLAQVQTYYAVAARDLAPWLHEQEEEPSESVMRWFRKAGVVWPVVPASAAIGAASALAAMPLSHEKNRSSAAPESARRVPAKSQNPEWSGQALAQKRSTLSGRNTTQQLVTLTGLTAREITRREKQARDDDEQTQKAGNRASGPAAKRAA